MKRLLLAALITALPSCVALDVVEGFRQFGGKPASGYAGWRNKQQKRKSERNAKP
jgi:predicted P-loop ATPase/GTPase